MSLLSAIHFKFNQRDSKSNLAVPIVSILEFETSSNIVANLGHSFDISRAESQPVTQLRTKSFYRPKRISAL